MLNWKEKGNQYFKTGCFEKAIECYSQGIENEGHQVGLHFLFGNRSLCFFKLGKFSEALADAQTSISLEPRYEKGHLLVGKCLLSLKKYKEAREAFLNGLRISPSDHPELKKNSLEGFIILL